MKQRPKIGELVKGWSCPCGCALNLDRYQVSDEQRLIALLGPTPHPVNLKPNGSLTSTGRRAEPVEPTVTGACRDCGAPMELFAYLVESLKLHKAPWPPCEACMRRARGELEMRGAA